ncbi:MAG: glutamate synthase (NADPH/NADH) large chain, partial [Paracoccaceae bacterium]
MPRNEKPNHKRADLSAKQKDDDMSEFDTNWAISEAKKREELAKNGMYRAEDEHSSCGVGLVVSIDGSASRKVVENGIAALKAV